MWLESEMPMCSLQWTLKLHHALVPEFGIWTALRRLGLWVRFPPWALIGGIIMAWLVLHFDDDEDDDWTYYEEPIKPSDNGDIVIAASTSALQAESPGSIPGVSTDV